jgi:hypothetical protein
MTPPDAQPPAAAEPLAVPVAVPPPVYPWYQKVSAVVFIMFCLEMGMYLLIVPWTDSWDTNYFSGLLPQIRNPWGSLYVRGAVSGLGLANLYISLVEILRLRRFARR